MKPEFISVYSRYNSPKIKDGAYVIHLDYKKLKKLTGVIVHWQK